MAIDKSNDINVGGTLHSIATGNIIAHADEVMDEEWGAKLSVINLTLKDNINNNVTNILEVLNLEIDRAKSAEAKLQANQTAEENRAKEAEEALQDNIDSLATDVEDNYAKQEGYYPDLVSGTAVNLEGKNDIVNAYMYRPTSGVYDVDSGVVSVLSIQGNAVAWNQVHNTGYDSEYITFDGVVATIDCNEVTSTSYINKNNTIAVVGHKYLHYCKKISGNISSGKIKIYTRIGGIGFTLSSDIKKYNEIITCTQSFNYYYAIMLNDGATASNLKVALNVFDLTLIYGAGNEPTTPEQFEADYQRWFGKTLEYEEYDEGSIRSVLATGIKTVGFNLSNINELNGTNRDWYGKVNINPLDFGYKGQIMIKGSIHSDDETAKPRFNIRFTDGTFTTPTGDFTYISPNGKIVENIFSSYATNANANVVAKDVCVSMVWSGKRNGDYEPYWEETQPLPITELTSNGVKIFPDGLKRAGDVYDEIFVENGVTKAVKRVGSVDLGTLSWKNYKHLITGITYNNVFVGGPKDFVSSNGKALLPNYIYQDKATGDGVKEKHVGTSWGSYRNSFCIKDSDYADNLNGFVEYLNGVIAYYELAEPITYIIDNFQLPLTYKVDDFGTEQILSPDNGIAPVLITRYGINAVDTIRRLPNNYISTQSDNDFLSKLSTVTGGTWSKQYNEQKNHYEYNYSTEGSTGLVLTKTVNGAEWKDSEINLSDFDDYVRAEEIVDDQVLPNISTITREDLKKDLFIDLWNTICGSNGRYNEETGYFELNGRTDISYLEAVSIYTKSIVNNGSEDGGILLEGYATELWVLNKNYLTEHLSLEGYATEKYVKENHYTKEETDSLFSKNQYKIEVITENQYNPDNYEENTIYFIIPGETWTFGGYFPIAFGEQSSTWTFGKLFPIKL